MKARYEAAVSVRYHDLFEPGCPPLPPDSQLPLVLVNDDLLSSGGKLSLPIVRRYLDGLGVMPDVNRS